jgi:hypothetical protein
LPATWRCAAPGIIAVLPQTMRSRTRKLRMQRRSRRYPRRSAFWPTKDSSPVSIGSPGSKKLSPAQRARPSIVTLLLRRGEVEAADTLLSQVIKKRPKDARTWLVASRVAYEQERLAESYSYMRRALELDFPESLHEIVRVTSRPASFSALLGKADELADWISETTRAYPQANLRPARPSPEALISAKRMRRIALERRLPSALLITQGKSGSVSIGNIFTSGFSLPTVLYSFVDIRVVLPWAEDFMRGGGCYTTHLLPTERNIDLLVQAGARSLIVNVRDPRQLLISQIEHGRRYSNQSLPSERLKTSAGFAEALDRTIRDGFPEWIAWIEGWVKAGEKLTVNFTTFEEFVTDKERFLEKILGYYGGDQKHFRHHAAFTEHAGIDYHRRRGEVDEWRGLLSPLQLKQVNSAIPDHFWEKFGWRP